jgi:hypothetical protein
MRSILVPVVVLAADLAAPAASVIGVALVPERLRR